MKITLIAVGKTKEKYLQDGVEEYVKRLTRFATFDIVVVPEGKTTDSAVGKQKEGEAILAKIEKNDYVVLLDERGKQFTSEKFAGYIDNKAALGTKTLVFVIGGAFGFTDKVYERANEKIALSEMTFSHQMIRLFFTEQLYRAYTIIKGHPYHNEG
jgi:23S rRNA (pseudouridine1915-N3)-methyltransferase